MGRILTQTAEGLFPVTLIPRRARKKSSRKICDFRFLEKKICSETSRGCK
jgi:hypothetical protein